VKLAPDHLTRPGAQAGEHQLAMSARYDRPLHSWFDSFLDRWLGRQAPAILAAK
jgi:hypothetical protein